MFALDPKMAPRLALLACSALAGVTAWRGATAPDRYPPGAESVHAQFAAIVMGATAVVVIRIGRLRARWAGPKRERADALALNQELATRVPLTGLLNRRSMFELPAREHARSARGHSPLSIALLDIDGFKRVSDFLGPGAGDDVLRRFATVVGVRFRPGPRESIFSSGAASPLTTASVQWDR